MKSYLLLCLALASIAICCFGGGSSLYPWPIYHSWNDLASWAQPLIASGSALPAASSAYEGDLFIVATDTVSMYRKGPNSWMILAGGGGTATSSFPDGISIGSGTVDASIARIGIGTLKIASYIIVPPETATPTNNLATGTLWYDSNQNKLRCYDGSMWHNLF